MTEAGERPAPHAGVPDSLGRVVSAGTARGVLAFVLVAAIGQALALAVWAVADTGASLGTAARIGWIYFGAFHHVAIELDVADLAVAVPGSSSGTTSLSVGVALLSVTAVAGFLLFRGGRAVAGRAAGRTTRRVLCGAAVAPGYALPAFALALLTEVHTPLRLGTFASGELHVALSPWQALAFPLAIAAAAGAAGGLRSALDVRDEGEPSLARLDAAVAGGSRMFALAVALSLGGLFVAGVVQPDEPVALLTPSTARYFRAVLDRPAVGLVALGHHVAVAPNEGLWTLVPAMGGCGGVRGSESSDFLCYRRFPTEVGTTVRPLTEEAAVRVPLGGAEFGTAPVGYFLFLFVPAIACIAGGRAAAARSDGTLGDRLSAATAAGAIFAALVTGGAVLASVTIGYGAAFGQRGPAGWIAFGPNPLHALLWSLTWGVGGGALGVLTAGRDLRRGKRRPRTGRGRPR